MLFNPTPADVRRFFCGVYAKQRQATPAPLEPIEQLAALWMNEHPEYWDVLSDVDAALAQLASEQAAGVAISTAASTNPFLHLSMHLSISEQCSVDQPRGVRRAVERLIERLDDLHDAHHAVMDALQQMLWDAQANQRAFDGDAYVDAILRRATRD